MSMQSLAVMGLIALSLVGLFVLIGLGKVSYQEGQPALALLFGGVLGLAQPFERKDQASSSPTNSTSPGVGSP